MKLGIITLAAALSVAAALPAQAQETQERPSVRMQQRMDPAEMVNRRVEMLTKELSLSSDQAAKVKTILTKESEQMRAHFEKNRPADGRARQRPSQEQREAMRAELAKIREQTNSELANVLNEDQLKKYKDLQEKQRERMREGGRRPRRGDPRS